ncbi:MAG: tetratricopeptide repeat protein [Reichenbachiella sp.]
MKFFTVFAFLTICHTSLFCQNIFSDAELLGIMPKSYPFVKTNYNPTWKDDISYEEAIDRYTIILKDDSLTYYAYVLRALCNVEIKRFYEAQSDLIKVINAVDNTSRYYFDALVALAGLNNDITDYDEALRYLNLAEEINPLSSSIFFKRGIIYDNKRHYQLAIENFERATSLQEDFWPAYINLGKLYRQRDELEKSLKSLQQAISLNPENALGYTHLGSTYSEMDSLERANEYYSIALELDSTQYIPLHNRAHNYFALGELELARIDYHRLDKMISDDKQFKAVIYCNLARLYFLKEDYNESVAYGKKTLNLEKKIFIGQYSIVALFNMAISNLYLKNFEEAKVLYEQVLINDDLSKHQNSVIDDLVMYLSIDKNNALVLKILKEDFKLNSKEIREINKQLN